MDRTRTGCAATPPDAGSRCALECRPTGCDDRSVPVWIPYALLAPVFAALVAVLGKVGVKQVDPTLATAVRSVVMMVTLVTAAAVLGKSKGLTAIDGRS